jgi:hypothetical protein
VRDNTVIRAQTLEVNITRNEGPMEITFSAGCELAIGDEPTRGMTEPKPEDKHEPKQAVVTIPPVAEARTDTEPNLDGKQRTKQRTQPPPAA